MPNQQPPDMPEYEQQSRFGKYGFQPLKPFFPGDVPSGVILTEQITHEVPPMGHLDKRHVNIETTQAHMLMRAKRKPTDWRALTWTFDGMKPIQLVGIRVGRESVILFNGTADVIIARKEVDARATSNENFILKIGNTIAIDTEGEFWAFAAANTVLQLIETWYDLDSIQIANQRIRKDKLELRQYGDMKSSTHERKIG